MYFIWKIHYKLIIIAEKVQNYIYSTYKNRARLLLKLVVFEYTEIRVKTFFELLCNDILSINCTK